MQTQHTVIRALKFCSEVNQEITTSIVLSSDEITEVEQYLKPCGIKVFNDLNELLFKRTSEGGSVLVEGTPVSLSKFLHDSQYSEFISPETWTAITALRPGEILEDIHGFAVNIQGI